MSASGEQLVSFFLYSLVIYPVTNYIISPKRNYSRWKAAVYAILFLALVSTIHLLYENHEKGPNHYQLLGVTRDTNVNVIKKAYRGLSLELHPDKNKADNAAEDFQKVKIAFDVLVDKEKRREYNRLGDSGVQVAAQRVIDHKYLLIQLIVYYASSLIFAFLMTFSEPSGDAFSLTLFGLTAMLLAELLLVVQEVPLPSWLLPQYSAFDIISTLHRLFPAFMNGCRCITGAFYTDVRVNRVTELDTLYQSNAKLTLQIGTLVKSFELLFSANADDDNDEAHATETAPDATAHPDETTRTTSIGLMNKALKATYRRVAVSKDYKEGITQRYISSTMQLISNPKKLVASNNAVDSSNNGSLKWVLIRDFLIYLAARFLLVRVKN